MVGVRWPSLAPNIAMAVASHLAGPVVITCRDLLGNDAAEAPTQADLEHILDPLLERWSPRQVRFAFTFGVCDGFSAADNLAATLQSDGRLAIEPSAPDDAMGHSDTAGDHERGFDDDEPDVDDDDAPTGRPEDDETLFTSLDRLMITTAVASANGQLAAPDPDELVELIEELLSLNSARKHSYFHIGFVGALLDRDLPVLDAGLNQERREWLAYGRLSGLTRRGAEDALAKAALGDQDATAGLIADEAMGDALTAPIIEAVLPSDPVFAARLLMARTSPFRAFTTTWWSAYNTGRRLLLDGHPTDAEHLFMALLEWASVRLPSDDEHALVVRRIAACHRATGDLTGASEWLDQLGDLDVSRGPMAAVATERGLIKAGIGRLTDIRIPRDDGRRIALMESLGKGRADFEQAHGLAPGRPHAAYCLGVLALCEDRTSDAARLLEAAESGMRGDPLFEESKLRADATFHRAAAMLAAGEIGREDAAFAAMNEALAAGCRPSPKLVVEAAGALAVAGAPSLVRFVTRALELNMSPTPLAPLICEPARQGDPAAAELALLLGGLGRIGNMERLDCLLAAFEGFNTIDPSTAERALDAVEDLLISACSDELDARWLAELEENDGLRNLISAPAADLLRSEICARLGRTAEACSLLGALARRAANGTLEGYDPDDLVDRLIELGAPDDEIAECRAALSRREGNVGPVELDEAATIRVLFVGGDERQAQYDAELSAAIDRNYNGHVYVEFFHPGWGSNWPKAADRVEARYPHAQAVVLMPLVRTLFGRRIRRTAGEAGLPWIACTGRGRAAIEGSIQRAIEVAARE
jgi:hypothetical protein